VILYENIILIVPRPLLKILERMVVMGGGEHEGEGGKGGGSVSLVKRSVFCLFQLCCF